MIMNHPTPGNLKGAPRRLAILASIAALVLGTPAAVFAAQRALPATQAPKPAAARLSGDILQKLGLLSVSLGGTPELIVYPVAELQTLHPAAGIYLAALRQVLLQRSATIPAGSLADMVIDAAAITVIPPLRYVAFEQGAGVSFLVRLEQDLSPLKKGASFYAFQGLTHDGRYFLAAVYPASGSPTPSGKQLDALNYASMARASEAHVEQIVRQLSAQFGSSPAPDAKEIETIARGLLQQ